jgi:hypothetical protein
MGIEMRNLVIDRLIGLKSFKLDWSNGFTSAKIDRDNKEAAYRKELEARDDAELIRMLIAEANSEEFY